MNQITIGRNAKSSIVVPAQYKTVDDNHVTITREGSTYTLEDHSTNGTFVNGTKVLNSACHIALSDVITLGRKYTVDMEKVKVLLADAPAEPAKKEPVVEMKVEEVPPIQQPGAAQPQFGQKTKREEPKILKKWSWGGFGLSWLYAAFNGVYWPLAIPGLIIFPQVLNVIPIVGPIMVFLVDIFAVPAALIVRIMLGVKGHSWAWNKFNGSVEEFEEKQSVWDKVGLIFFIIGLLLFVVMPIVMTVLSIFVGITDILDWGEYLWRHFGGSF